MKKEKRILNLNEFIEYLQYLMQYEINNVKVYCCELHCDSFTTLFSNN